MHKLNLWDEVNDIRRVITKPSMKTKENALKDFKEYCATKHKITDFETTEAKSYLAALREWKAMDDILRFLEV